MPSPGFRSVRTELPTVSTDAGGDASSVGENASRRGVDGPRRASPLRRRTVHGVRILVVVGLLALLPSPHGDSVSARLWQGALLQQDVATKSIDVNQLTAPPLSQVQAVVPSASKVSTEADAEGLFSVDTGKAVAKVSDTMPWAEGIAGYRGPTGVLLRMDEAGVIQAATLSESHDTDEHVEAVVSDAAFWDQFVGLGWGGTSKDGNPVELDGVSGATLTSLAAAGGVLRRLGGERASLLFTEPLSLDDARLVWPDARSVTGDEVAQVQQSDGSTTTLIRTGVFVDDEIGYQGPTELLIGIDSEGVIETIRVRGSLDNEPYVGYVREEKYTFWPEFRGMTLDSLSGWDAETAGVEGISGATMTSMAVARTLPRAAASIVEQGGVDRWLKEPESPSLQSRLLAFWHSIRWSRADLGTVFLLLFVWLAHRFRWFHQRFRPIWLLAVIGVIGLWSGNLISLALIAGWATSGVSVHLAVGLVLVFVVALLSPPTRGSNPYCNHLCPHGAAQQLLRPGAKSRRRIQLPVPPAKRFGLSARLDVGGRLSVAAVSPQQ